MVPFYSPFYRPIPVHTPEPLRRILQRFLRDWSKGNLRNPNHVVWTCGINHDLVRYSARLKPLHLIGHRTKRPNRHKDYDRSSYSNPDRCLYHAVAVYNHRIVVDLTYRQLDSKGPPILITTLNKMKQEWIYCDYKDPM